MEKKLYLYLKTFIDQMKTLIVDLWIRVIIGLTVHFFPVFKDIYKNYYAEKRLKTFVFVDTYELRLFNINEALNQFKSDSPVKWFYKNVERKEDLVLLVVEDKPNIDKDIIKLAVSCKMRPLSFIDASANIQQSFCKSF